MRRHALRFIGAEELAVGLILASVGLTLLLVISVYRRKDLGTAKPDPAPELESQASAPAPATNLEDTSSPGSQSPPAPPAEVVVVDPTPAIVARLATQEAEERARFDAAVREAEALEASAVQAEARTQSWIRRELIVREQIDTLEAGLSQLEADLDRLARQRDVLARERDEARLELSRARSRDGFSLLPYKGPNGTWRRPVAIECHNGTATLQPGGPTFGLLELGLGARFRGSPFQAAVARALAKGMTGSSPDGTPVVPYIVFVVRPDGIRPYYEARAALEPLGIAFGYELIEQDTEIEYPDLDDLAEWSETAPLPFARRLGLKPGTGLGSGSGLAPQPETVGGFVTTPGRRESGNGTGLIGSGSSSVAAADRAGTRTGGGDRSSPAPGTGIVGQGGSPASSGDRDLADLPWPAVGRPEVSTSANDPEALLRAIAGQLQGIPSAGVEGGEASGSGRDALAGLVPPGDLAAGETPTSGSRLELGRLPNQQESGWPAERLRAAGPAAATPFPAVETAGRGRSGSELAAGADRRGGPAGPGRMPASGRTGAGSPGVQGLVLGGSGMGGGDVDGEGPATHPAQPGGLLYRPERPFELTILCGTSGLVIQPGGYRLDKELISATGPVKLTTILTRLVQRRQARDPQAEIKPKVTFLIEPGGSDTFWKARSALFAEGLDWPLRLRLNDGEPFSVRLGQTPPPARELRP